MLIQQWQTVTAIPRDLEMQIVQYVQLESSSRREPASEGQSDLLRKLHVQCCVYQLMSGWATACRKSGRIA